MVAVSRRERNQPAAVEIDAIVVNEIRVLIGIAAAGTEPDLALVFINPVDLANDVLSLRNLIFDGALFGVHKIEVPPTIPFGDIDQLVGLLEPGKRAEALAGHIIRADKRFRLL